MTSISELIKAINEGNALNVESLFESIMAEKVEAAINDKFESMSESTDCDCDDDDCDCDEEDEDNS